MNIRVLVAEFVGTFALIFIGAASIAIGGKEAGAAGLIIAALAHGLVLSIMISALGHISGGHFNPAVSIGLWITQKIGTGKAASYIIAQLLGGAAGGYLLAYLVNPDAVAAATPALGSGVSVMQAVVMEAVLTFFLMTAIMGTAVDPEGPKGLAGFGIGIVLIFDILVGGNYTGAAMNPARSFGPALAGSFWVDHWVYWVGPCLGAGAAALLYQYMRGSKLSK